MKLLRHTYLMTLLLLFFILLGNTANAALLEDEQNTIEIFQKFSPLVVNVHRIRAVMTPYNEIFQVRAGTGSGFFWDDQGHIVTNYHVVKGSNDIVITLKAGKSIRAKILGAAPKRDIAVLKIDPKDFPDLNGIKTIPIADSQTLQVGQKAIAIGNPFGLDQTVTRGIISALGRKFNAPNGSVLTDMIQTDASINPGNSGGPLLNSNGELIGMNTAIYSQSGASDGIGFAVPANTIKRIVTQLIATGRVEQIGLGIQRLDDSIAKQLDISGVIVAAVAPNTPAAEAGLQGTSRDAYGDIHWGDVIVGINDIEIENNADLESALDKFNAGDTIKLSFKRNNQLQTRTIKLIDLNP